jgi:hypothetical protein
MAQDNQNRNPQRQDDSDQMNREGRADVTETEPVQGGVRPDQSQDDDMDEDDDRDLDDRAEGGSNRRRSIS